MQPSAAGPGHCSHPEWGWEPGTDSEPWPWAPSHGLRVGEGFPWAAGSSVRHFGADEYAAQQRAFCFQELRVGCARQNCCLFSRFNFPAFLVMLTLALGQQGNGRIYLPNVRQPETVRFPGWGWLLSTCPRYVGEQGPEKLCHGDSENQAPWAVPRPTGATREPHQDTPETVSTPSVSHSLHTGPQPVRGPGGST